MNQYYIYMKKYVYVIILPLLVCSLMLDFLRNDEVVKIRSSYIVNVLSQVCPPSDISIDNTHINERMALNPLRLINTVMMRRF